MATFVLERPVGAACRIWLCGAGRLPVLVSPLSMHRRKYGDLYDWGPVCNGSRLTAATLLHQSGLRGELALLLADEFMLEVLMGEASPVVRLDTHEIALLALDLVEKRAGELARKMVNDRRGLSHVV